MVPIVLLRPVGEDALSENLQELAGMHTVLHKVYVKVMNLKKKLPGYNHNGYRTTLPPAGQAENDAFVTFIIYLS